MRRFVVLAVVLTGIEAGPARAQFLPPLETSFFSRGTLTASSTGRKANLGASIGSGARALAMGGAFIAVADDGTAASWNPAGLCVLERPEASAVGLGLDLLTELSATTRVTRVPSFVSGTSFSDATFERTGGVSLDQSRRGLDFVSFAYPIRRGRFKIVPQFSFQRAIDLGLDLSVAPVDVDESAQIFFDPSDPEFLGIGRTVGSFSAESDASGGIDIYAGSLGVSFREDLFFGVSFNWWRGTAESNRVLLQDRRLLFDTFGDPTRSSADTRTYNTRTESVTFDGFNLDLGVLFRPIDKLRVGAVYKLPFELQTDLAFREVDLLTSIPFEPTGDPLGDASLYDLFPSDEHTTFTGQIEWPQTLGLGVAFMPTEVLTLSTDFTWSNWSETVWNVDASTTIDFVPEGGAPNQVTAASSASLLWPSLGDAADAEAEPNRSQIDTQQFRFGAEYIVGNPGFFGLAAIPLRAGAFTDRQYFRDGNGDPVTYLGLTAGFGLVWSRISLDLAYVHQSGSFSRGEVVEFDADSFDFLTADTKDSFRSNRFYISTIVRF